MATPSGPPSATFLGTAAWHFRPNVLDSMCSSLCLGAPLFDLLVLRHGAHPVDVRPHHRAHLRQGFLEDCLLLCGFILDADISQDWQECSHSSRNDLRDHSTVATLIRVILSGVRLPENQSSVLVTKFRRGTGPVYVYAIEIGLACCLLLASAPRASVGLPSPFTAVTFRAALWHALGGGSRMLPYDRVGAGYKELRLQFARMAI